MDKDTDHLRSMHTEAVAAGISLEHQQGSVGLVVSIVVPKVPLGQELLEAGTAVLSTQLQQTRRTPNKRSVFNSSSRVY